MKYLITLLFLLFINITSASVTTDLSAPNFELVDSHGKNSEDTGSTESQIAIFTERVKNLTEHLKINKKDKVSRTLLF